MFDSPRPTRPERPVAAHRPQPRARVTVLSCRCTLQIFFAHSARAGAAGACARGACASGAYNPCARAVCAACATCTTPSFTYDLAAYATPDSGWLVVDGATTTPAVGNDTSGTAAAQFYYAVCPSATTGQWLDPEQIRCGQAPPAPYAPEGSNPGLADPR